MQSERSVFCLVRSERTGTGTGSKGKVSKREERGRKGKSLVWRDRVRRETRCDKVVEVR